MNKSILLIALLALGACSAKPIPIIVHQTEIQIPPRSLDTCPVEVDQISVRTEADVKEIAKSNRIAYIECRSSLGAIWEWLAKAAEQNK
jgi:uncharacterized lipoprotein YajG